VIEASKADDLTEAKLSLESDRTLQTREEPEQPLAPVQPSGNITAKGTGVDDGADYELIVPKTAFKRVSRQEFYAGPIPHPAMAREWEDLVEGSAKEFLEEWRDSRKHERTMQTKQIDAEILQLKADIESEKRGNLTAFAGLIVLAITSIALGIMGQGGAAAVAIGATMVGVVTAFLKVKQASATQSKDEAAKNKDKENMQLTAQEISQDSH
jgi:hypothetical protein